MDSDVEIFADDIDLYLQEYIRSRELDRNKIPSSQWAAAMMYVNAHTFRNGDILRTTRNRPYEYNLDAVSKLLDKYIFMCADYCQRVCIEHFCLLSGMTRSTINYWANGLRRSGDSQARKIVTKLIEHSMMSADDLMLTKSGVNSIAYRNATQERYSQYMSKQTDQTAIDMTDLGTRLGIGGTDIKELPDKQQEPIKHEFLELDLIEGGI